MTSKTAQSRNAYSQKTLIGNWQENRALYGEPISILSNQPMTTYNIQTSTVRQPATEFKNLQPAGYSQKMSGDLLPFDSKVDDNNWSSLSLPSKGPKSDNPYMTTIKKSYGITGIDQEVDVKNRPGIAYNNRTWRMGEGHWVPESIDVEGDTNPINFGLKQEKERKWAEIARLELFNENKSIYKSEIGCKEKRQIHEFPERKIKTTANRSTITYPINNHRDFALRGGVLNNVVPDIVNWSK